MPQENLKLTSVRLDPDTLDKIDKFTKKHLYWKRNTIINRVLMAVMNDFSEKDVYDMVRRSFFRNEPVTAHYEISKAKIDQKP